jgi:hypothetical protein
MEDGSAHAAFNDVLIGMQIGHVYRLTVSYILNDAELEIFPTIELIDRLYPPAGMALRYPIPIELTHDELELAARGAFVTRVIYVEDPHQALPVAQTRDGDQPWVEAPQGEDPLVVADRFGRAVAILRIGGRIPSTVSAPVGVASTVTCGPPPLILYDATEQPRNCPDTVLDVGGPALSTTPVDKSGVEQPNQP